MIVDLQSCKCDWIKIFSDGASRGNPGPSAIAFIILSMDGEVLKRDSRFIGIGTNNQAEYRALIHALEAASDLTDRDVICHLDSELVVKQLNKEYKVHNPALKDLWLKVNRIKERFRNVSFHHVQRTNRYIHEVDRMANKTLDEIQEHL